MKSEETREYNREQMKENNELEQLRQQVMELKDELNKSRITTQSVIRKAMRSQSSWLDNLVKIEVVSIPVLGIIMGLFSFLLGASLWPVIVFVIMSVISTWLDWHTLRIASSHILTMPMSQLKESLIRQKRYRMIQTVAESPVAIGWLFWYILSLKKSLHATDDISEGFYYGALGGGLVGTVVALIVIIIIYKKAQKTNNELIETIDSEE